MTKQSSDILVNRLIKWMMIVFGIFLLAVANIPFYMPSPIWVRCFAIMFDTVLGLAILIIILESKQK